MKKEHDTRDLKRIDVHESWNLNFWCEELNLRADELKEIVKRVGPDIAEIRLYLARDYFRPGLQFTEVKEL